MHYVPDRQVVSGVNACCYWSNVWWLKHGTVTEPSLILVIYSYLLCIALYMSI